MKRNLKVSSTAYRVLYLFNLLNNNDCTIEEIINSYIYEPYISRDYSSEVILKYINTLRRCGFVLYRYNSGEEFIYKLDRFPDVPDISDNTAKFIADIEQYLSSLSKDKLLDSFNRFINKLLKFYSSSSRELIEKYRNNTSGCSFFDQNKFSKYSNLIRYFDKCCVDELLVEVFYQSSNDQKESLLMEPKSIEFENKNIFLCGFNLKSKKKESILIDFVIDIKQLPNKARYSYPKSKIIFKLSGDFSQNYTLHENDKLLESSPHNEFIVIESTYYDLDKFYRRILKYGRHCEILKPDSQRQAFRDVLLKALVNYV